MKKIQKDASLHEKTVQAVARGAVAPVATGRRRGRGAAPVELTKHIKLHPMVLTEVQEIIAGPHGFTRYDIIDATTAVVR